MWVVDANRGFARPQPARSALVAERPRPSRSRIMARSLPSGPSELYRSMTFISRLCTSRVPPEAILALPIVCDTSARRWTAARISASSRSISKRSSSMLGVGSVSTLMSDSASSSRVGSGLIRIRASRERERAPDPEADRGAEGQAARPRTPAAGIRTEIVPAHRARIECATKGHVRAKNGSDARHRRGVSGQR